jgi:hypothetical protein
MFTIFFVIAVFDVGLVLINGYYIPLVVRLTGEMSRLVSFGLATLLFIVPMGLTLRYLRTHRPEKTQSSSRHAINADQTAGYQG